MTRAEMQAIRKGAISRILHGRGGAAEGMRTSLLARLASLVSPIRGQCDEVSQHALSAVVTLVKP